MNNIMNYWQQRQEREKQQKRDKLALKVGKVTITLFNYLIISSVILALLLLTGEKVN